MGYVTRIPRIPRETSGLLHFHPFVASSPFNCFNDVCIPYVQVRIFQNQSHEVSALSPPSLTPPVRLPTVSNLNENLHVGTKMELLPLRLTVRSCRPTVSIFIYSPINPDSCRHWTPCRGYNNLLS